MIELHSWGLLAALGAFHGVNPGMGWLFAVALGLQERRRRAVLNALVPLGLGHALAVAAAVAVAALAGAVLSAPVVRAAVAAALLAFGVRRLVRHSHPAWASMRVGFTRLTLWSFLMASAHGAGLMVVPIFLGIAGGAAEAHTDHAHHAVAATSTLGATLFASSVHAAGYLVITGLVALLVFEKLGVGLLRKAWLNTDTMWAAALIVTGIATLLV
jgi:hypothetical protein